MRGRQRLGVYVLVTAIVEGLSIIVLHIFGYPHYVQEPGMYALLVALNFFIWFLWMNALAGARGPYAAAPPGSLIYNPLVQLISGVIGMFIIVVVIGEVTNWLKREMMGTEKEQTITEIDQVIK